MYSMNLLAPNAETLYFYSTILTFLSALAALGMEFLISIGLGFGETSFDFLIGPSGWWDKGFIAAQMGSDTSGHFIGRFRTGLPNTQLEGLHSAAGVVGAFPGFCCTNIYVVRPIFTNEIF